jgi:hypothetical protein
MIEKSSLIEAIGLAAVVLSLVFVGLEVNESTRATRSATAAETTATIAEWYTALLAVCYAALLLILSR